MKKLFYSIFAAISMILAVTSCSQEEVIGKETSGNEVEVSFNLEMEGQTASRAIGDGLTVDEVIMGVFDEAGTEITNLKTTAPVSNLGAVVKVRLVKGQTYQFVFWAQKKGAGHYDTDDMAAIKLNANNGSYLVLNNDETRDAFYAHEPATKVTSSFSKNITMKRPFAQLNLATTEADLKWAENAGVVIDQTTVTVEGNVYSQLNTLTGYCSKEIKATFELNAIPDKTKEKLTIKDTENQFDNDDYYFLSTSYLLTSAKEQLSKEIVFTLKDGEKEINTLTVTNAPLQRNWRTNIIGEILTGEGTFNIVIDPIFDADRNYPMDGSELDIWDGTTTEPELVNGVYIIDEASDLIGLAEMNEDNLKGATFELTKDLSFKNVESRASDTTPAVIEPLFSEKNGAMNITFKGNDHVIRDFIINGENSKNSLFGGINGGSISNLTIINAEVKGQATADGRAAIVVAQTFGTVKLESVIVKDSKLEGVQKIGGLIGFVHEGKVEVSDCTVDGLTLNSIELAGETGGTGGLIGYINQGNNKITNSYVKNSTLKLIQSVNEAKRANGEFIGIIAGTSHTEITNCGVEGNIFNNSIEWTPFHNPLIGANRGDKATLTINGKAYPEVVPNYEDKGGYYEVYTAEGLLKWAYAVNKGQNTLGMHLMRDITLPAYTIVEDAENATYKFTETPITVDSDGKPSGSNWVPVCNANIGKTYNGTIEGNNFVIKGMNINYSGLTAAFVGYMEGGSIQHMKLQNANVYSISSYVGAFVGYNEDDSSVSDCHLIDSKIVGDKLVGGIVGGNWTKDDNKASATISNCTTDELTTVIGTGETGGNNGSLRGTGGIVGQNWGGIIFGCKNEASVNGKKFIGGIIGSSRSSDSGQGTRNGFVIACENSGNVSATDYVGGIAGENITANKLLSYIIGCSSTTTTIEGSIKGLLVGSNSGGHVYSCWAKEIEGVNLFKYDSKSEGTKAFGSVNDISIDDISQMNTAISAYNAISGVEQFKYTWSWTSGSWPVLVAQ